MIPTGVADLAEALQAKLNLAEPEAIRIAWAIYDYWRERGREIAVGEPDA